MHHPGCQGVEVDGVVTAGHQLAVEDGGMPVESVDQALEFREGCAHFTPGASADP
jgi:hypothetical protein